MQLGHSGHLIHFGALFGRKGTTRARRWMRTSIARHSDVLPNPTGNNTTGREAHTHGDAHDRLPEFGGIAETQRPSGSLCQTKKSAWCLAPSSGRGTAACSGSDPGPRAEGNEGGVIQSPHMVHSGSKRGQRRGGGPLPARQRAQGSRPCVRRPSALRARGAPSGWWRPRGRRRGCRRRRRWPGGRGRRPPAASPSGTPWRQGGSAPVSGFPGFGVVKDCSGLVTGGEPHQLHSFLVIWNGLLSSVP